MATNSTGRPRYKLRAVCCNTQKAPGAEGASCFHNPVYEALSNTVVETYMRRRLPPEEHPSFPAVRDVAETVCTELAAPKCYGATTSSHPRQELVTADDELERDKDDMPL